MNLLMILLNSLLIVFALIGLFEAIYYELKLNNLAKLHANVCNEFYEHMKRIELENRTQVLTK